MKHCIIGTAGHIDHGKTALVKALTGIDCDTHKEEKRRGITITLGFAHLTLASGDSVGIVDVPGHRDFVHTMVSGASGIDCVLLVIAADEGVMPQTREHLAICQILGIGSGIIVINKADLVDEETMAHVKSSVREAVQGTFLQDAVMAEVSCLSGQGMDGLRAAIAAIVGQVPERPSGGLFWMYIDRIFSVSGFGTVVTGSVKSGVLRTGCEAYVLPPQKKVRVRRMERFGAEVSEVAAGDRASLNLVGISKEEFMRGMLVSDRPLTSSTLLDVRLRLFDGVRPLELWSQAMFIMGTFEAQARIHLLEHDRLKGGETGLAQLHLPHPCVAQTQDAFVLRSSSSDMTVGGGKIVDPHPLHHRKRRSGLVDELKQIAEGKLPKLVAIEAAKHQKGIDHVSIARTLNVSPQDVLAVLEQGSAPGVVTYPSAAKTYCTSRQHHDSLVAQTVKYLSAFHQTHPFDEAGRTAEELQGMLGMGAGGDAAVRTNLALDKMVRDGTLKRIGRTYSLSSHSVKLSKEEQAQMQTVEELLKTSGIKAASCDDLASLAQRQGIDEKRLRQLLDFLVAKKAAYYVDAHYLHAPIVDRCRKTLLEALSKTGEGLTVARFRDLVSGNRKICLLLYALFDGEGITERRGDVRVITEKGKAALL